MKSQWLADFDLKSRLTLMIISKCQAKIPAVRLCRSFEGLVPGGFLVMEMLKSSHIRGTCKRRSILYDELGRKRFVLETSYGGSYHLSSPASPAQTVPI